MAAEEAKTPRKANIPPYTLELEFDVPYNKKYLGLVDHLEENRNRVSWALFAQQSKVTKDIVLTFGNVKMIDDWFAEGNKKRREDPDWGLECQQLEKAREDLVYRIKRHAEFVVYGDRTVARVRGGEVIAAPLMAQERAVVAICDVANAAEGYVRPSQTISDGHISALRRASPQLRVDG